MSGRSSAVSSRFVRSNRRCEEQLSFEPDVLLRREPEQYANLREAGGEGRSSAMHFRACSRRGDASHVHIEKRHISRFETPARGLEGFLGDALGALVEGEPLLRLEPAVEGRRDFSPGPPQHILGFGDGRRHLGAGDIDARGTPSPELHVLKKAGVDLRASRLSRDRTAGRGLHLRVSNHRRGAQASARFLDASPGGQHRRRPLTRERQRLFEGQSLLGGAGSGDQQNHRNAEHEPSREPHLCPRKKGERERGRTILPVAQTRSGRTGV